MATLSGKSGTVNVKGSAVSDATGWSINTTSNNPSYGSSDTSGWKSRVAGVKDATGSYSAKYNGAVAVAAGDTGSGVFTLDGSATYTIPIVVDGITLEVDMDDGDVIGYSVDWGCTGALVIS